LCQRPFFLSRSACLPYAALPNVTINRCNGHATSSRYTALRFEAVAGKVVEVLADLIRGR
jgi:hypothetical protein